MLAAVAGVAAAQSNPEGAERGANGVAYDDLIVGVPYEAIGTETSAGAAHVVRGGISGLTATGNQLWYQDVTGVVETSEAGDEFGFALVAADFNGDNFPDLAVGVHGEAVGSVTTAGAVHVFYGTAAGLAADGNELWHQDSPGIEDDAEADDRFGWALGAGDFNGDGYDDLAVGAIWEDLESVGATNAGAVHVIYGSASGLTSVGAQVFYEDTPGLPGTSSTGDQVGAALAAGDFDHDGHDDLVIGVPWNDTVVQDSGLVYVIYGADAGLNSASAEWWYQGLGTIADTTEAGDRFGHAVAAGDIDGDGYDDLAVGVPYEDIGDTNAADAGAVHVIFGSAGGLAAAGNELWHQDVATVQEECESGDRFGSCLAIANVNGDDFADLAIGVDGESVNSMANAGAVQVLLGSAAGLVDAHNELVHQDQSTVEDQAEADDRFGWALGAGDFNGDGYDDLSIGIPFEDLGTPAVVDVGAVSVVYGSATGLTPTGDQLWAQDSSPDISGTGEAGDSFGLALATTHNRRLLFADGFERGTAELWSTSIP